MYPRLLLSIALCAAGLCAQPRTASLRSEAAVPQIQFAAGEIHRALAARGITLAEGALDGLPGDAASTRFVLASDTAAARLAAQLGVAGPKSAVPQAYAIRVKQEPARRTYIVLAAMRRHPLGRESAIIGMVTDTHPAMVTMKTAFGTTRIVDMLPGDQLPRIC